MNQFASGCTFSAANFSLLKLSSLMSNDLTYTKTITKLFLSNFRIKTVLNKVWLSFAYFDGSSESLNREQTIPLNILFLFQLGLQRETVYQNLWNPRKYSVCYLVRVWELYNPQNRYPVNSLLFTTTSRNNRHMNTIQLLYCTTLLLKWWTKWAVKLWTFFTRNNNNF